MESRMTAGIDWRSELSKCGYNLLQQLQIFNSSICTADMIVPQRVVLSYLGFLAIVNAYAMRYCLDIALTQMVTQCRPTKDEFANTRITPLRKYIRNSASFKTFRFTGNSTFGSENAASSRYQRNGVGTQTYDWSEGMQTVIVTSFYVGYVLTHIPGALLAQKYGGKWILCTGILLAAIFTLLTPLAIRAGGPHALIVMRIIIGLSEGPTFPALSALLSQWVPASERGKLGVLVLSGGQIGFAFVKFVSSLLLQHFEWTLIFYFFGGCALIWCVCFAILCYSYPESDPFIKESEKQYLLTAIGTANSRMTQIPPTPWKEIFKSAPIWALISATVQYDWMQFHMSNDMQFVRDIKQLSFSEGFFVAIQASVPYILNWIVSLVSGVISDLFVNRNLLSTTATRRLMTFIAALGPNFFNGFESCWSCAENNWAWAFFNCAMGVMGTYYAGIKLSPLDMSPNYAGAVMGITNGIGSLTGIFAPYLHSIVPELPQFNEPLRAVIWLACTILTSGEIQTFNDPVSSLSKN